jgi:glycoside hydrolase-like protein
VKKPAAAVRKSHTPIIAADCICLFLIAPYLLFTFLQTARAQANGPESHKTYLGFDRNDYPGDENLAALRRTFSFAGYWLNVPPRAASNTWVGKRKAIKAAGFGFLVLFNGRLDAELKKVDASALGRSDAEAGLAAVRREGFPNRTVIFLDQEEGGRMLPEQKAYIYAWVDSVNAGGFRAGIYCSGIAPEGPATVIAAEDIRQNAGARKILYWVANDACPPSPGCTFPRSAPRPASSIAFADIWQYAQSPRRKDFAGGCSGYAADGECYPPGLAEKRIHVDLDIANSEDPSRGK